MTQPSRFATPNCIPLAAKRYDRGDYARAPYGPDAKRLVVVGTKRA